MEEKKLKKIEGEKSCNFQPITTRAPAPHVSPLQLVLKVTMQNKSS
jgi:hypothetical protein